jgi:hypothetical protein
MGGQLVTTIDLIAIVIFGGWSSAITDFITNSLIM